MALVVRGSPATRAAGPGLASRGEAPGLRPGRRVPLDLGPQSRPPGTQPSLPPPHSRPSLLPADPDDQYKLTEDTRQLGLVVCRGTSVVLICPQDGMEAIPNPFIQQQDA